MIAKTAKGKSVSATRKGGTSNKDATRKGRGVTKGSIRRMARRGGCKRLAASVYDEARELLSDFVTSILKDAQALMQVKEHNAPKTMRVEHILYALKKRGRTMYIS